MNTKSQFPKSAKRLLMEKSATYLASGAEGKGLDVKQVNAALWFIGDWKKSFVHFLTGKTDKEGNIITVQVACTMADKTFLGFYNAECRAFAEPTMDPYWTRQAGPVEFGEDQFSENREVEEVNVMYNEALAMRSSRDEVVGVPTDGELEAFHVARGWADDRVYAQDDEVVEREDGFHASTELSDWQERTIKYGELLSALINGENAEKILLRAAVLAGVGENPKTGKKRIGTGGLSYKQYWGLVRWTNGARQSSQMEIDEMIREMSI